MNTPATSSVEIEDQGGDRFLVSGELSFQTVTRAWEISERLFTKGDGALAIDFEGVDASDSAGLALLVEWIGWARREHRALQFYNVPEQLISIAKISEIDKLLPVQPPNRVGRSERVDEAQQNSAT